MKKVYYTYKKSRIICCLLLFFTNLIFAQSESTIKTVSVKSFGAKGDGVTDDYAAIQKACSSPYNVYFPKGKYVVSKFVKLRGGRKYTGESASTTSIVQKTGDAPYGMGGAGMFYIDSGSTDAYVKNNYFSGLTFEGEVNSLGHGQFTHLLALAGTDNTTVENCVFKNFRGDGIYVSAALSYLILPRDFRRNKNISIKNCVFDGGSSYKNRNGISVTDCDGIIIDGCKFINIGNSELSKSVGAVDFEREKNFSVIKNAVVKNCSFTGINQLNTAAITIMGRGDAPGKVQEFTFSANTFTDCYWGIFIGSQIPLSEAATTWDDDVKINGNTFSSNTLAIYADGKKISVDSNTFLGTEKAPSIVNFGSRGAAYDVVFSNNKMTKTGKLGSVNIDSLQKGVFSNNTFTENVGYSIFFFLETAQSGSSLSNIDFSNNKSTSPTAFYYFGHGFGNNKKVINGSINDTNNIVSSPNYFAGEGYVFNGSVIKSDMQNVIPPGEWTDQSYIYYFKNGQKYKKTFYRDPAGRAAVKAKDELAK